MSKWKIPARFLVNRMDVQEICENYIKKRHSSLMLTNIAFAGIGAVISTIIADEKWKQMPIFWLVALAAGIILIIQHFRQRPQNHAKDLLGEIDRYVLEHSDYTGIFLVSKMTKPDHEGLPEKLFLMTQVHEPSGEVFLLYIKNLERFEENGELNIGSVKEEFSRKIEINDNFVSIEKVHNYEEIKRTSSTGEEKMIRYVFFKVHIADDLQSIVEKKYEWKSMADLLTDPKSMGYNLEVLTQVNNRLAMNLGNSFYKMRDYEPIKIIWNITNQCNYHCDICATHSDRRELKPDEKNTALLNILSIGRERIRQIDFSGGDPLSNHVDMGIIVKTQAILGKEKVSVTTTGEGITKAKIEKNDALHDLLTNCEITIDEIEDIPDYRREAGGNYYSKNLALVTQNAKMIGHLTVNVPILRPEMNREAIISLVDQIKDIQVTDKSCTLIRLMRTGKLANRYDDNYNPISFIRTFLDRANEVGLYVHLQCALEGAFYGNNYCCTMLHDKIGVDCAGNVFACAWGGYVSDDVKNNPFFLGNVYEEPLSTILSSEKALTLKKRKKNDSGCCCVFSYFADDTHSIFSNKDPLIGMVKKG